MQAAAGPSARASRCFEHALAAEPHVSQGRSIQQGRSRQGDGDRIAAADPDRFGARTRSTGSNFRRPSILPPWPSCSRMLNQMISSFEPSAGNGLLIAQLPHVPSCSSTSWTRSARSRLANIFPGVSITGHRNGAAIAEHAWGQIRPSLILMNPPFSRSLGRGADHLAAVRHLAAAITHLRAGGRIVAIMPDWVCPPSAKMREVFENTLAPVTVQSSIRLEQAYIKHGTSIAVRLYVLDKVPATRAPATIQRRDVAAAGEQPRDHASGRAHRREAPGHSARQGHFAVSARRGTPSLWRLASFRAPGPQ